MGTTERRCPDPSWSSPSCPSRLHLQPYAPSLQRYVPGLQPHVCPACNPI